LKDGPGSRSPERLEATLRVTDARHAQGLHQRIEDAPHVAPQGALRPFHTALRQGAAADQHVGARGLLKMREEGWHFLQRGGEIGIHEQHDVTPGLQHATADRIALAAMHQVVDDVKARVSRHHGGGPGQRVILGALHDQQHFCSQRMGVEKVADLLQ
jgi:hypothetical protein